MGGLGTTDVPVSGLEKVFVSNDTPKVENMDQAKFHQNLRAQDRSHPYLLSCTKSYL
jgi:hypothetical protein